MCKLTTTMALDSTSASCCAQGTITRTAPSWQRCSAQQVLLSDDHLDAVVPDVLPASRAGEASRLSRERPAGASLAGRRGRPGGARRKEEDEEDEGEAAFDPPHRRGVPWAVAFV